MNTGIYKIEIGDYFYIGQSINMSRREIEHKCDLKKGKHCNSFMQNVFNKKNDFNFKVLVYAESHMLDDIEQGLIDSYYEDKLCMNASKDVESPMRGMKHSDKSCKLMALNHVQGKVYTGKSHWNYDNTIYSYVHKDGVEERCTQNELMLKYNLSQAGVNGITTGRRKTHKGWRLV